MAQSAPRAVILLALAACASDEAREYQCVAPLVELVRWRDGVEEQRLYAGLAITPAELAAQERDHVLATVPRLGLLRPRCDLTWNVLLMQPPTNPGLRVREEAMLLALDRPPHDYSPDAVGFAGVTLAGRIPDAALGPREAVAPVGTPPR